MTPEYLTELESSLRDSAAIMRATHGYAAGFPKLAYDEAADVCAAFREHLEAAW